jgi:RNA polymerase sigma factor (sigma-70 family)
MRTEIETYFTNNYYHLLNIAKKITKGHDLHQDLLHEVILQVYNKEEIELRGYDDNQIKYWLVSIMRINWHSKTSPFFYKVRREIQKYSELTDVLDMEEEQHNYEKEIILSILETSFTELTWFHKSVLQMYLVLGSLKKVSNQTDIPITSVARYVREAKKQMRDDIEDYYNNDIII